MQIEAIDRDLEVEQQDGDSEIWVPDSSPMPEFPHDDSDDLGIRGQHAAIVGSRQVSFVALAYKCGRLLRD